MSEDYSFNTNTPSEIPAFKMTRFGEPTSGDNMWLLDLIAPNKELAESLLIGFGRKAAGKGDLRLHPIVRNLVDTEVLERMTKGRERAEA